MRTRSLKFLVLLLVVAQHASSQKRGFEYKWDAAQPHTVLPDSLRSYDAVMIYYNRFLLNDVDDMDYIHRDQLHYKVKILTPMGLSKNTVIIAPVYRKSEIIEIDARTIKPNGKVVDLTASDVKVLAFREPGQDRARREYRFAIPGVEVGDEVEIVINREALSMPQGKDILLKPGIPVLKSALTIRTNRRFSLRMVQYNGMSEPVLDAGISYITYQWLSNDLPLTEGENLASVKSELPYVSYMLVNGPYKRNDELYKLYLSTFEDKNYHKGGFPEKFLASCGVVETQTPYQKFQTAYNWIVNNMEIVELTAKEESMPIDYFVQKKYIDHTRLHILVRKVFDACKLRYDIVLGRSRYEGYFDHEFVPPQAVTAFYFLTYDDSSHSHVVYPGYSQVFYIDELPVNYKATGGLVVHKPVRPGADVLVKDIEIPATPHSANYHYLVSKMDLSTQPDSIRYKCKETFSGDFSTVKRSALLKQTRNKGNADMEEEEEDDDEKKEDILTDLKVEELNTEFPFVFKCSYYITKPNVLRKVNPQTYYVRLGDVLSHTISEVNDGKRTLHYYPLYTYTDVNKIILSLDREIASDNLAEINKELMNDHAGVKAHIERADNNKYTLEVTYEVKSWQVPPTEIDKLRAVNKMLRNLYDTRLVVVFK